jgi:Family of unknown function (DUF6481)
LAKRHRYGSGTFKALNAGRQADRRDKPVEHPAFIGHWLMRAPGRFRAFRRNLIMKGYQTPSFQERVGRAAAAKQKAIDALKARPVPDEAALAARREAAEARAAAQAEKRAAAQAARAEAEAARAAATAREEAGRLSSEEARQAARDARYAARKARK